MCTNVSLQLDIQSEIIHQLQLEVNNNKECPLPIPWLNSKQHGIEFFAIPSAFNLNRSQSFQSGRVYGMDVTSGAAVGALLLDLYDDVDRTDIASTKDDIPLRVLDLCCAPGLKLCMMADLLPPSSMVVGVDISSQRISLCKKIIKKYHIDEATCGHKHSKDKTITPSKSSTTIRLYCTDGTTFGMNNTQEGLVFDSNTALLENESKGKRKRMNKSARAREKRRLKELQQREEGGTYHSGDIAIDESNNQINDSLSRQEPIITATTTNKVEAASTNEQKYDRVLVDAECSSDGAIRHRNIDKQQPSSSSIPSRIPAWNDTNMNELVDLQKHLIESGFRLLKTGGIMVYSTCSLSSMQNEQVIQWLLNKYNDAYIIPVSFASHDKSSLQDLPFIEEGSIHGTVRFNPLNIKESKYILPGSGFFLARIGKRYDMSKHDCPASILT